MRAIQYASCGDTDALNIMETDIPDISADEVLVRVLAASLNPFAWKVRNGTLRQFFDLKFPITPGRDGFSRELAFGNRGELLQHVEQMAEFDNELAAAWQCAEAAFIYFVVHQVEAGIAGLQP